MKRRLALLWLVSLLAVTRCVCGKPEPVLGRPVAAGDVRLLTSSPDGGALAWLANCVAENAARPAGQTCEAWVFSDGTVQRVGLRAPLGAGLQWSATGELAVLGDRDRIEDAGELRIWTATRGVEGVAAHVSAFAFARGGRLVYVSRGQANLRLADGTEILLPSPSPVVSVAAVPGAAEEEHRGAVALGLCAGGELLSIGSHGGAALVAREVAAFGIESTGRRAVVLAKGHPGGVLTAIALEGDAPPRQLGLGVVAFQVATSGDGVAFVAREGNREVLYVGETAGGAPLPVARAPTRYLWAAGAPVLAWHSGGELGVTRAGGPPRVLASDALESQLAWNGSTIAYTSEAREKVARHELFRAEVDSPAPPVSIAFDVRGFSVTSDGKGVFFGGLCEPDGASCALLASYMKSAGGAGLDRYAGITTGFKIDTRPTGFLRKVLFEDKRGVLQALSDRSQARWERTNFVIDRDVDLESVLFLPPDSRRIAYVVRGKGRAGVYVAEVGDWGLQPPPGGR